MNSKIEISARGACVLSLLVLLASACSGSRSALSTEPLGASTSSSESEKSNLPACGSMTKPCDPNNLGGQTCSSLGAGSGTLLCDPVTCSFDRSMCTGTGTQGGGGLGALLSAFGRGQGGRTAMGMNASTMGMGRGGRGGAMAGGGRGGSQGRREDSQMSEAPRNEGGSGGEKSDAGDKAEGGQGGSNPEQMSGGAGGQAGDSAQAGAGAGGGMSQAGAGGEAGSAAMSEMPAPQMPAPMQM